MPPRLGCDPTSVKLDSSQYFLLYKVCNVNNKPKLLLMVTEYGLGIDFNAKAFIKIMYIYCTFENTDNRHIGAKYALLR